MSTLNINGKRMSESVAKDALKDQGIKPTKANLAKLAEITKDKNDNNYLSKTELSQGAKALLKELGGGGVSADYAPNKPIASVLKVPPASLERYSITVSEDKTELTFDPRQPKNLFAARAAGAPKAKSVNVGHTFLGGIRLTLDNANGEPMPFKDAKWIKASFKDVVPNKADLKRLEEQGYDIDKKRDILSANTTGDKTPTFFALRDIKIDENAPEPVGGPNVKLAKQDLTRGFVAICSETTIEWFGDRPQITVKKPVVYVYPTQKTTVTLTVDPVGRFTTQYPMSTNGTWKMIATPDGTLYDPKTEKKYSYLFWEASNPSTLTIDETRAHCVRGEDCERFLEDACARLALNDKERTDLVSFWLPAMQRNAMNLVQVLVNEECERVAKMTVDPRPDSEIRVFLLFRKIDARMNVGAPNLPMLRRTGYTVVEWGGANLDE